VEPAQKYAIDRVIGRGGMAEVYKARMTLVEGIERAVALKRVHPALARDSSFARMFVDEARLSMLLAHANIVQVFDVGKSGEGYFLVMEYVEGIHLGQIIDRGAPLPPRLATLIVFEICKALEYAHTRLDADGKPLGVIHRDVSPTNVMLSREGEVKLADFGLAKAASQRMLTAPGTVKGKIGYMSPESLDGRITIDRRADIFSAGILLWELLTGRHLFQGDSDIDILLKVKGGDVLPPSLVNPEVDPALEAIVMRALARDREVRYQHARDLGEALAGYLFDRNLRVTSWDIADVVRASRGASVPPPPPPPMPL
jgi:serine/threonine-protein kinase